jgi:hypothetical protein
MTWLWLTLAGMVLFTVAGVTLSAVQPRPPADLSDAHIRTALRQGRRLVAIRWYRILHQVDLKRAKAGVAALAAEESSSSREADGSG